MLDEFGVFSGQESILGKHLRAGNKKTQTKQCAQIARRNTFVDCPRLHKARTSVCVWWGREGGGVNAVSSSKEIKRSRWGGAAGAGKAKSAALHTYHHTRTFFCKPALVVNQRNARVGDPETD